MLTKLLILLISLTGLLSCIGREDDSLDSAIPRLQSPPEQIAYTRTKWLDGQHVETTFYDHQDRVLESFSFGRSSSKVFNQYENNLLKTTISYSHSDSSEPGYLSIDTLHRKYDARGRLAMELHVYGIASKSINVDTTGYYKRILDYTTSGDTIIQHLESSF
mgnify:CR=1 FL=1